MYYPLDSLDKATAMKGNSTNPSTSEYITAGVVGTELTVDILVFMHFYPIFFFM